MQSRRLVCLVAAASLGLGSVSAFAQDHHRGDRGRDHGQYSRQDRDQRAMGNRGDRDRDRDHENRDRDWNRGHENRNRDWDRGHDRRDVYYYGARGPEWHRGGRVPAQYRGHQYVVNDWRGHRLSPPPRGYQWVQVGNDYVLAAIATGIIAQLLLNNAY